MASEVALRQQLEEALKAQRAAEATALSSKETIRELEAQIKKLQSAQSTDDNALLAGKRKKILDAAVYDGAEVGLPIPLSVDSLVDSFIALYTETKIQSIRNVKPQVAAFLERYEPVVQHLKSVQQTKDDYLIIKAIGKGYFAKIYLAKRKSTGKVCVLKEMSKSDLLARSESVCFRNELDFLILAASSSLHNGQRAPGITALQSAFHDRNNVYLVMDFYPGGDLLGLLGKREQFSEEMVRFYIAELVLAIDTVHKLGYAHRDIKIDNLLLDSKGHLVLADFGSCCPVDEDDEVDIHFSGGTRDYLSPELLAAMEGDSNASYGPDCDWWSMGVVMYEMLVGETPFYADSALEMYKNIKNYKTSLRFPNDIPMSDHAKDLIRRLCTSRDKRIGSLGVEEIMEHPFFMDISWNKLRKSRTPFVPELASATDTAFFEDVEDDGEDGIHMFEPLSRRASSTTVGGESGFGNQLPFVGYVFNKEDDEPSTTQKRFRGAAVSLLQGQSALVQQIMGSPVPGSPVMSRNLASVVSAAMKSPIGSPMLGPSSSSESLASLSSPKGSLLLLPGPSPVQTPTSQQSSTSSLSVALGQQKAASAASESPILSSLSVSEANSVGSSSSSSSSSSSISEQTGKGAGSDKSTSSSVSAVASAADNGVSTLASASDASKSLSSSAGALAKTDTAATEASADASTSAEESDEERHLRNRKVKFSDLPVFMDAAKNGDLRTVKEFIETGKLTVNSKTEMEQTALHAAAAGGQLEVAEYLLSKGASVNAADYNLTTPLHCAAFEDEMDMIKFLIEKGADPDAANADDEKPADVAGDDDVAEYITSHMTSS